MKPVDFDYARPDSLKAAGAALGATDGEARALGGGMSLGPMLNLRLARPARLVDLTGLPELTDITETATDIRIGAATTHARIEDGATPEPIPGLMRAIAGGIAYRAVRTRGTIGGSLAHADPAADWLTATTMLAARIETLRPGEATPGRSLPMPGFIRGAYSTALEPGEIIAAVTLPRRSAAARWGWHKTTRKLGEFASAIGAVLVDPEEGTARVVAGATGGAPLLLDGLAADLARTARPAEPEALRAALTEALGAAGLPATPIKTHQLAVAVRRAMEQVCAA